ncbi:hypothetical protein NEOLEDRAFT_965749 [Neolentinus lepideus HHB14362 ss-1]|uniref:Uncharacterized protein n=1 Tax=Neolentinus lepideus HHB14362 ss-1 TaxID=1314782 RepID=A0A165NC42_9AGAM|nr:hypothetical protein NEOLEDRAFT_965749 [Neolentinus lepideus HHB14362 ss-1]
MSDKIPSSTSERAFDGRHPSQAEAEYLGIQGYVEEQLNTLRQLLQTGREVCQEQKRVIDEEAQTKAVRREQKERRLEDVQANSARIARDQAKDRRDATARRADESRRWDTLKQELDTLHEARVDMLTTFVADSIAFNRRQQEEIRAAIEENQSVPRSFVLKNHEEKMHTTCRDTEQYATRKLSQGAVGARICRDHGIRSGSSSRHAFSDCAENLFGVV